MSLVNKDIDEGKYTQRYVMIETSFLKQQRSAILNKYWKIDCSNIVFIAHTKYCSIGYPPVLYASVIYPNSFYFIHQHS